MRREVIEVILDALGSDNYFVRPNSRGDWGMTSCPLAKWTHQRGTDRKPSFAVSISHGRSWCKCFSCGFTGSMISLVNAVYRHGGITDSTREELRYLIILEETRHYTMLERESFKPDIVSRLVKSLGKEHHYWETRGFDRVMIKDWNLGYSEEESRVLIPWYDWSSTLVAIVGRGVYDWVQPRYRIYPDGFQKSKYLFGEHRLTGEEDAVLVVEGQIDAIVASKHLPPGIGVVATGGADVSDDQVRKLRMLAKEVILCLDNDNAGTIGRLRWIRKLGERIPVSYVDLSPYKDPAQAGADLYPRFLKRKSTLMEPFNDLLSDLAERKRFTTTITTTLWGKSLD